MNNEASTIPLEIRLLNSVHKRLEAMGKLRFLHKEGALTGYLLCDIKYMIPISLDTLPTLDAGLEASALEKFTIVPISVEDFIKLEGNLLSTVTTPILN